MEFSIQEYWSRLPGPPPGDLPDPGIKTTSLMSPALVGGLFTTSATQKAWNICIHFTKKYTNEQMIKCLTLLAIMKMQTKTTKKVEGWRTDAFKLWSWRRFLRLLWTARTSVQFSTVAQSCPTLGNPMDCSTPGLSVHHQLPEFTQTHIHWVGDAIQPSHLLSSPSPPAFNLSQQQGLFKWVSSSHQVAKVLEFQLLHQSFQRTFRTDFF